MTQTYFAVDLGATSGRTIIGSFAYGELKIEEVNRFPNQLIEIQGHYYWDIFALYTNILEGLKIVAQRNIEIASIGIDTWGVDFLMVGKDGYPLRQPYAYRDPQTTGAPEKYFHRVPRGRVYELTGIQVMNFNSLFQFDTLRRNNDCAFEITDKILFMPDALSWLLTGEMVTEYTIASTAQIVNARTRKLEPELIYSVGLSEKHFGRFVYPGERIGVLTEEVQRKTGLGAVPVIAVAGHDTGSAVASVPALGENFAYISSGTWSLMGIETSSPVINEETETLNFTNEGGVAGTIRLLKNICGMWLLERCRSDWPDRSYSDLIAEAKKAEPFRCIINPDEEVFANPQNMREAIRKYCKDSGQPEPDTCGETVRCIFDSLALRYREVLNNLRKLSLHPVETLHVIGGGSKNDMLNQFTADSIGIPVIAGPSEATAIGNVMIQAIASGAASDILSMRKLVNQSISLTKFKPQDTAAWDQAYEKYQTVLKTYNNH